ncbi:hypothetical protein B0J12DRAFT_680803 [Macrophomina phaseolina]|uniref:Alpha/beta hydrolase fold-3 domain-containing protein n=1 Tax=Macrophomina phaseolina TaxID=35725 RepID=A0ABQ8FX15_9PEZI|nr:hypothetical protein B0J12DRAFT_680803 [Macrophomina phaseolina]
MVLNTITVGAAVTPTVIQTYFSHYLNRKPLHGKPTAHLGYHEGLQLVREFLHYAAEHTVEEVQAFTQQWVPVPTWVRTDDVTISSDNLARAADLLQAQLGPDGIELVGGKTWWQWRRDNAELKAEWIEMRKDYNERKENKDELGSRIMLYIHGGAYYFGSVDEHRYQMQRHARKLKARVFAPRYRLAPQFPFPCGLQDAIAAYLHLLEKHDPSTIIVAGDSAGGGMTLSMLCTLRDQGIPLPAGGVLLSPWVDLTHSFPSLSGDGKMDYIPAHGFVHKPSVSWPPPNDDDMNAIIDASNELRAKSGKHKDIVEATRPQSKEEKKERARGYSVENPPEGGERERPQSSGTGPKSMLPPPPELSITIDGKLITIKDQIQLYATNGLIVHPLVSPVLQPTLGGLPPLLIQVGGGELLRDEQIYLAHKAASPMSYLPDLSKMTPEEQEKVREQARKHPPTNVKLEVWDDLCHVTHTLSFTRPAKLMYRAVAQFSAWALAKAQDKPIDILDDDAVSHVSSSSESGNDTSAVNSSADTLQQAKEQAQDATQVPEASSEAKKNDSVGRAGDGIPPFVDHMIRQRINRHGAIRPLEPPSELEALTLAPSEIGVIKEGPVRKWMNIQQKWAKKYEKEKRSVQKKRIEEFSHGYEVFEGEKPPPTALAGRRLKDKDMPKAKMAKSWGLAMWSGWGSKHDQMTIKRETQADTVQEDAEGGVKPGSAESETKSRRARSLSASSKKKSKRSLTSRRSRSRRRTITDEGQADSSVPPSPTLTRDAHASPDQPDGLLAVPFSISKARTSAASVTATISTRAPEDVASVKTTATSAAASPLPSPRVGEPTVVISEHAAEGAPPTIIPPSHNTTVRPTRDGIAYPFKLNIGNHKPNPSTVTLMSFQDSVRESMKDGSIAGDSMDKAHDDEKEKSDDDNRKVDMVTEEGTEEKRVDDKEPKDSEKPAMGSDEAKEDAQRPSAERFVTATEL